MGETLDAADANTIVMYTFRFGSSNKSIQLTQEQLESIPYLATLISHKDDFLSIQNERGEYVLNSSIDYTSFTTILHTIASQNPYVLFNELSEDHNIMNTLQLRDYFGINSFPLPLLKNKDLLLTNPSDKKKQKKRIEYHKANLLEARQTAAEFIVALSRNEYNLLDNDTKEQIFTLIKEILSNATVFSSRFRHHTFEIVKECCFSFFSKNRQSQLFTAFQMTQYYNIDIFMYLDSDDQSCPDDLYYTFVWRGAQEPIEKEQTKSLLVNATKESRDSRNESNPNSISPYIIAAPFDSYSLWTYRSLPELDWPDFYSTATIDLTFSALLVDGRKENEKKNEALSARSGHFNTLPKRPSIDKFKHRCGPKTQKYR